VSRPGVANLVRFAPHILPSDGRTPGSRLGLQIFNQRPGSIQSVIQSSQTGLPFFPNPGLPSAIMAQNASSHMLSQQVNGVQRPALRIQNMSARPRQLAPQTSQIRLTTLSVPAGQSRGVAVPLIPAGLVGLPIPLVSPTVTQLSTPRVTVGQAQVLKFRATAGQAQMLTPRATAGILKATVGQVQVLTPRVNAGQAQVFRPRATVSHAQLLTPRSTSIQVHMLPPRATAGQPQMLTARGTVGQPQVSTPRATAIQVHRLPHRATGVQVLTSRSIAGQAQVSTPMFQGQMLTPRATAGQGPVLTPRVTMFQGHMLTPKATAGQTLVSIPKSITDQATVISAAAEKRLPGTTMRPLAPSPLLTVQHPTMRTQIQHSGGGPSLGNVRSSVPVSPMLTTFPPTQSLVHCLSNIGVEERQLPQVQSTLSIVETSSSTGLVTDLIADSSGSVSSALLKPDVRPESIFRTSSSYSDPAIAYPTTTRPPSPYITTFGNLSNINNNNFVEFASFHYESSGLAVEPTKSAISSTDTVEIRQKLTKK